MADKQTGTPISDLGLNKLGAHPAAGTKGHHACASQSAMVGIRTGVSDLENGRPYAGNTAKHRIVQSGQSGLAPGGDLDI